MIAAQRFLASLPIIGYAMRCLVEERHREIVVLLINLLMAGVLAVLIWGYPALITIALSGAAFAAVFIFLATLG